MRTLIALGLLALLPPPAGAAEQLNKAPTPAPAYTWRLEPGSQWAGLFDAGKQVGGFDFARGQYFRLLPGDRWEAGEAPAELPKLCAPDLIAAGETPGPKGVITSMLSGKERLEVGGEEVDARAYFGDQPKIGSAPYLLVTGDDEFLKTAKALFADGGRYSGLKARWVVGFFPQDWHTVDVGYRSPGVYFCGPADAHGKAKCYSFQAAPDLEGLDVAAASTLKRIGLRDPDPNFQPDKVPDLRQGDPVGPIPAVPPFAPWGAGVALSAATALYLYRRRKAAQ